MVFDIQSCSPWQCSVMECFLETCDVCVLTVFHEFQPCIIALF